MQTDLPVIFVLAGFVLAGAGAAGVGKSSPWTFIGISTFLDTSSEIRGQHLGRSKGSLPWRPSSAALQCRIRLAPPSAPRSPTVGRDLDCYAGWRRSDHSDRDAG